MLSSHRFAQTGKRLLFIVLIGAVISQACNLNSDPSAPSPANTPKQTLTQGPEPTNAPKRDLYAGFTETKDIPFVILHPAGEKIGLIQEINSSKTTGAVWISSSGEAIVIYAEENELPTSAVVGEDIIQYSNYTDRTVDVTIIHQDGTRAEFQAELDTELLNKITAFNSPYYSLVSFAMPNPYETQPDNFIVLLKEALYIIGAAVCIAAIEVEVAIPVLAVACAGHILETFIRVGKAVNLDVGDLETISGQLDILGCIHLRSARDCLNAALSDIQRQKKVADETVKNTLPPPNPQLVPTPVGPTSENPTLSLNQRSNCREGPSTAYEVVYSFEAGTQFEIIGKYGSGWWLVPIDLDITRKKSCWIYEEGNTISGDVNNVPDVEPSPLPPTEAPSSSADLPIYDFDSNSIIGYMTCTEASQYGYWEIELLSDNEPISYYSTIELHGSNHAGYYVQDGKSICGW
jgi:hypothetical protein